MRVRLSAHRGGPEGVHPPNSLQAMSAALEVGVDLVEFDVRVTRDGRFVTAHEATMDVAQVPTPIEQLTAAQVFAGGIGAAGLEDVLHLLRGRAMAHVDLKDLRAEVEIADLCEAALGADGFLLTTLEDLSVARLTSARPHLHVALSLGRSGAGLGALEQVRLRMSELFPARRVRRCAPTMLAVHHRLAWAGGLLRWAARRELPVLVWTLNDPRLVRRAWTDPRVWGFTTDFPRRALALRPADRQGGG